MTEFKNRDGSMDLEASEYEIDDTHIVIIRAPAVDRWHVCAEPAAAIVPAEEEAPPTECDPMRWATLQAAAERVG